ncbi:MAG: hypothetical protein RBT71_03935 [Flavobacteriales bacterium]|jgi:hypothetical protein|nr:hypothetical protein [Flavobacteriales bacterium]MDX9750211.1 hypothetical protein [Flavobacteriales bacterium]
MSIRAFFLVLALFPTAASAQAVASDPVQEPRPINAATRAVLLANKPERFTETQWLDMMEKPVNRSLYPLRITRVALDTTDARLLDPRYRYELVRAE